MVLYYSASGNTEYIARSLAKELNDDCTDLLERIKRQDRSRVFSKKPFVICLPVYVCEMPRFAADYLKRLPLRGNRRVYFVFTSGGYAGISGYLAKKITSRKKLLYMGHAEFKMPTNHIVSNAYPPTEHDECIRRISEAEKQVKQVAKDIRHGRRLRSRYVFLFEKLIALPFNAYWVRYKQPSKDFYTTDKCIGCGKCSRICPINNIHMENKRPVWEGPCAHCMGCILNCPFEAIEYGNITQNKEKYNIRKYIKKL